MRRWIWPLSVVGAGLLGWHANGLWPNFETGADAPFLANVDGHRLTTKEFEEAMHKRGGLRGQYQTAAQRESLLQELIDHRLLAERARLLRLDQRPEVKRRIQQLLINQYLEETLTPELEAVRIDDASIRRYFDQNHASYDRPERRRGAIILKQLAEDSTSEARNQARDELTEVLNGVPELAQRTLHFGALAQAHSDDQASRYRGGVIGWVVDHPARTYRWDKAIIDALFALEKPGEVSPLLKLDTGLALVRLVDLEETQAVEFERVKDGIKRQLTRERQQALTETFMSALRDEADIEIDRSLLASIQPLSLPSKANTPKLPAMPSS